MVNVRAEIGAQERTNAVGHMPIHWAGFIHAAAIADEPDSVRIDKCNAGH
ncbi:unannotated protein [freshwater metagenome]|uniref:Unannotated protein n=1 Tax=freshwater metagenome TaxID=449393 RepID=A0A6J6JK11_9ZZZZ